MSEFFVILLEVDGCLIKKTQTCLLNTYCTVGGARGYRGELARPGFYPHFELLAGPPLPYPPNLHHASGWRG